MTGQEKLRSIAFYSLLLFAATLTNALFFNQLGYYAALVFLGVAFFRGERRLFNRTGIEVWVLLFVLAEVLALLFSSNREQALLFGFKRVILIPIIYTVAAGIRSWKDLRVFFFTYLVFALASDLLYIGFSVEYFIRDLYKYTAEGPSVLVHPITTGELTTFTIVYLTALFLNETKNKRKILWAGLALISTIALVATDKRTAWIGVGLGIIILLILNRNYLLLGLGALCVLIVLLIAGNESEVKIYSLNGKLEYSFKTDGLAYKAQPFGENFAVSDFSEGLKIYRGDSLINRLETPSPIYEIVKWGDKFVSFQSDYRILLLDTTSAGFKIENEFTTPGFLGRLAVSRGLLYAVDSDSGITVYRSPESIGQPLRFPKFVGGISIIVDSNWIDLVYENESHTTIALDSLGMPTDTIPYDVKIPGKTAFLGFKEGKSLFYFDNAFQLADPVERKIKPLKSNIDIKGIAWNATAPETDSLYLIGVNKVLYDAVLQGDSAVLLSERMKVAKYPFSMTASDKYICLTDIKPSRVLSFFDLSGPSNRNRLSMWRIGWEMFKDHPFFGVGDIDLAVLFKQYNRPYEKEIKGHLHNNFIHILATLGGFGFIVIVAFFTVIIRKSCQIFRKTPEKSFERALVMGAIGGFASFIGSGLTEFNFGDHEIITMVWFSAGLVFAIDRLMLYKKEKETDGYYFRKDFESAV